MSNNHNHDETQNLRWIRADLHLHTPASEDYAQPEISYLEILQEAEKRNLEIIAFTDHNTVHGYEKFQDEIYFLESLKAKGRLEAEEEVKLAEYQRLLAKITVLPGFEFTSHYGAHIIGLFPPQQHLSVIESTLLNLGVSPDLLKKGACGVPNTRHVTEAYDLIERAGGLVIAPHANGPNGVITETLRLGTSGQSRVARTQSPSLHALEFVNFYTDHEKFTSPSFYNGKTEQYERRMFCIQGSDAHRLRRLPESEMYDLHRHGIGDRYVELLMPDNSFEALKALFISQDFDRVRVPKRDQKQWDLDALRFGATSERQILRSIEASEVGELWQDVAALANSSGGVLLIGCEPGGQVTGVSRPAQVSEALRQKVQEQLSPQPYLTLELMSYEGRDVIRVEVKPDELPPYISKNGVIFVRRANETVSANRSELLQLCQRALAESGLVPTEPQDELDLPRSGVEIVSDQQRQGLWYYEVRDLRTTAGVTRDKAQGLWAYAISRHEDLRERRMDLHSQIRWRGRLGIWRAYRQGNRIKYDLVHRNRNGVIDHIFYGVSDWGLGEEWAALLSERPGEIVDQEQQPFEGETERERYFGADTDSPPNLNLGDLDTPTPPSWGERRKRWRGRGGLWQIYHDELGVVRFDLVMKDKDGLGEQEYNRVTNAKLTDAWLNLIRVNRPRTGIEVVSATLGDDDEWRYVFRDLRTGDSSGAPWRLQDIKAGTVREYAARMYQQDVPLEDSRIRWWGNIGYMRPMRSQVDLVYRDDQGVDHFFYAARREELQGEWRDLLEIYGEL